MNHQLPRIKQRLVRDDVLSTLRAAILETAFKGGEHLVETELAKQLGTSRGPVREALKELAQEGLVVIYPNRGAVVATFSPTDILEITDLRVLIEGHATRLAVERATPADFARLEKMYTEMQTLADAGDLSALVEKDIEFHGEICALSGNGRLYRVWSSLASQIRLLLVLTDQVYFEPDYIVGTHTQLLEGIRIGDADMAESAITSHLIEAGQAIVRGMAGADATEA